MERVWVALRLARWHYTPLIVIPVAIGSALAWYQGYPFRWKQFLLCLAGAWFAHLGANAANDCFDDISGVDRIAHQTIPENRGSTVCGSGILTTGRLSRHQGLALTAAFFLCALACGAPLMIEGGWPVAALALIGFALALFYCARPIAFGYAGHGLGELGIFVAFGVLPVVGSYLVQTNSLSWSAVLASLPPGLFTVSVLYNHHFTHLSADAAVGKRSPVVVLGERRARALSPVLLAATYLALVANVMLGVFPPAALAGLVTAPLILRSCVRLEVPSSCSASLAFLFGVVKANVATGALVIGALVVGTLT